MLLCSQSMSIEIVSLDLSKPVKYYPLIGQSYHFSQTTSTRILLKLKSKLFEPWIMCNVSMCLRFIIYDKISLGKTIPLRKLTMPPLLVLNSELMPICQFTAPSYNIFAKKAEAEAECI